jgi:ribosomal protein S1
MMDTPTWKNFTDYQVCHCCGAELDGMILEVIPGRRRIQVTCRNSACDPAVAHKTLAPHVHYALCDAQIRAGVRA